MACKNITMQEEIIANAKYVEWERESITSYSQIQSFRPSQWN